MGDVVVLTAVVWGGWGDWIPWQGDRVRGVSWFDDRRRAIEWQMDGSDDDG